MNTEKDKIKLVISGAEKDFKRFELIEHFIEYVSEPDDVYFLLNILKNDKSSVVRHEAAAQLLKIQQKKPWILDPLKEDVIKQLLYVVINDQSMVAKHESAEALSYIGDEEVARRLGEISSSLDGANELIETLEIAKDTINYRFERSISAGELSSQILKEYSQN